MRLTGVIGCEKASILIIFGFAPMSAVIEQYWAPVSHKTLSLLSSTLGSETSPKLDQPWDRRGQQLPAGYGFVKEALLQSLLIFLFSLISLVILWANWPMATSSLSRGRQAGSEKACHAGPCTTFAVSILVIDMRPLRVSLKRREIASNNVRHFSFAKSFLSFKLRIMRTKPASIVLSYEISYTYPRTHSLSATTW